MSTQKPDGQWDPRMRELPGSRIVRLLLDLFRGVEARHAAFLLLRSPRGLFQPYGTTSSDRYPKIFARVRELLDDANSIRILSVGCATGEEAFTLRNYFPKAKIKGIDINPLNIAVCRFRRLARRGVGIEFATAGSLADEPTGSYNAVFAMAVFRHGELNVVPPPEACDHLICFEDFETFMREMARILKPNGFLIMQHAMFRFTDTETASAFIPVMRAEPGDNFPLYDRNNRLLRESEDVDVIFQKRI